MTLVRPEPLVLVVVPNGTCRPEPLATAVRREHPGWDVRALWAGDPHLRPATDGDLTWIEPPLDVEWEETLVAFEPLHAEWMRMLAVGCVEVESAARPVVALWAGAVAVLGSIACIVPTRGHATVVGRALGPIPDDGCRPDETDLAEFGNCSPHVVGFSPTAGPLMRWLAQRLAAEGEQSVGRILDRAVDAFHLDRCLEAGIGSGSWRWDDGESRLLDVPAYDARAPWVLDASAGTRARIDLVGHVDRQEALRAASAQLEGVRQPLVVPGGITLDPTMRRLVRGSTSPVPSAWTQPGAFRAWLQSRYWAALHRSRRDLAVAFPRPSSFDSRRFETWSRRAFVDDEVPLLVGIPERHTDSWEVDAELSTEGLNVVGYLTRESSLGDVARRLLDGLGAAGVPLAALAQQRTASPELVAGDVFGSSVSFASTLAVVNADQFPALQLDHPELFEAGTHMIGYWFWELEFVPAPMRRAIDLVDEIWAGSTFVADAFAAITERPVRYVPIPVPEPIAAARHRGSFSPLRDVEDRLVLGVVFDHFSVTERKNPFGAIEAFKRAFAADEGPVLVVKSMNGDHRWPQHQRVLAAAEGRPDIIVWDEHLERADQMAFIRSVDVLVSLHRSEGLGLHLAEAMWLGTPVIATRYSGNLDFMDDDCAVLIDATLVNVEHGEGVYPPEARWADPDLDQAAAAMRRMVADPKWAADLAAAGRRRMEQQPSLADTGRHIAHLLGLTAPTADGRGVAS